MKLKITGLIITSIAIFAYCTPKVGKEITKSETTTELKKVESVTVPEITRTVEEFEQGKLLMSQKCSKCHVLFDPIDYTLDEWEKILKIMIPKARLSEEDGALVRDYIIAHAKDYKK